MPALINEPMGDFPESATPKSNLKFVILDFDQVAGQQNRLIECDNVLGTVVDFQNNLTAHAGGGQGSATQITHSYSRFGTVASSGDSAILVAPGDGSIRQRIVVNAGANPMNIFPMVGAQLSNFGTNTPYQLNPGGSATFTIISSTQIDIG